MTTGVRFESVVEAGLERVGCWDSALAPAERAALMTDRAQRDLLLLSYIDGYRRIRRTEPMIALAAERFEQRGDRENADFWHEHRLEEAGHESVMLADIERMTGAAAAGSTVLERYPITPPSAALLGYFEWQLRHHDPHALIVLRYFLEMYFARIDDAGAAAVHELVTGGSATLSVHREADADHVEPCRTYIERNFEPHMLPMLEWSVDFVARSLCESQVWAARAALGGAVS